MLVPDIVRGVLQRWRMMLFIFLGVMAFTVIWIMLTPREYRATATLLFDSRAPEPMAERTGGAPADQSALLATEAQILRSEMIAIKAADQMGLTRNPTLRQLWSEQTNGAQSFRGWLARRVQTGLEVLPSGSGNTIEIAYLSPSAETSATMANAFASAFNETRLSMRNDVARQYAGWFEKRMRESQARMEAAQAALARFQREHGIVATGSIDAESTRLGELSSKLSAAEANSADASARAAGGASMPEVLSSGVVQGLRAQIAAKSAEIRQMSAELGPNHALMLAARAQLGQLQSALATETGKASGSLAAASGAAAANKGTIQALLDRHRGRMLALASDRGKLSVLESNVESARKEYDAESQQLSELRAKSTIPTLNVLRLNSAEPPLLPQAPNVPIRILMMTILGLMLAIGSAVLAEWMRPRVRSRDAISYLTGVPVLGQADLRQIGQQLRIEGAKWS